MIQADKLIESIQNSLFQWYDFSKEADIYFYDKQTVSSQKGRKFDYILSKADLETYENPTDFLCECRELLKKDGHLLFAVNNRFGLRYFCGDKDVYTNRCFDGLEDYAGVTEEKKKAIKGRMYTKAEIQRFLKEAGFLNYRFFSVLSDLDNPGLIYREDFLPNEDLMIRAMPTYHSADTVFLDERLLYKGLVENGMFHQMANAYIIECTLEAESVLSDVWHVTSSIERGKENAMLTIIYDTGKVEKRALFKEGRERLQKLFSYGELLKERGIKMVPATFKDGRYEMPFMEYENGQVYLKRLMKEDSKKFLKALDSFRENILKSSKIVKEDICDGEGAILEYGYYDMIPLNSFFDGEEFVFFDQEYRIENYPANVMIYRMIVNLYYDNVQAESFMPRETLLQRYQLDKHLEKWQRLDREFLAELRNEEHLEAYHQKTRLDYSVMYANRRRIGRSAKYYDDIFQNIDGEKVILFGSGVYAERYWNHFAKKYPVYCVVDNNRSKWGTYWHDVPIYNPEWLLEQEKDSYKVIVCVGNYEPIAEQLEQMGIKEYAVFDTQRLMAYIDES